MRNECPWCGYAPKNGHEPMCLAAATVQPPKPVLVPLRVELAAASEGIERAHEHADDAWKARANEVIRGLAESREEFFADDVWEAGLAKPREARALGGLLRRFALAGVIEPTQRFVKSRQSGCHATDRRIWRSLVFQAGRRAS